MVTLTTSVLRHTGRQAKLPSQDGKQIKATGMTTTDVDKWACLMLLGLLQLGLLQELLQMLLLGWGELHLKGSRDRQNYEGNRDRGREPGRVLSNARAWTWVQ